MDPPLDARVVMKGEKEHAREEGHVKKKKKKKSESKGENKPNDDSFVENQTLHEVTGNAKSDKKKKKKSESKGENKPNDDSFVENQTLHEVTGNAKSDKKKKKKSDSKGENKPNDDSFVENQTLHEVTGNAKSDKKKKKKQKNLKEDLGDGSISKEGLENSHVYEVGGCEDNRLRGNSSDERVKKKRKKIKSDKCRDAELSGVHDAVGVVIEHVQPVKDNKRKRKKDDLRVGDSEKDRDKGKRKEKSLGCNNAGTLEDYEKNEAAKSVDHSNGEKKSKKVKFSDNVEVFPVPDITSKGKKKKLRHGSNGKEKKLEHDSKEKSNPDDGLIRGKRFSKDEDEAVQNAVYKYIEDHRLGEQGLEMVLHCKSHPELKDCWKEIGEALPHRPYLAVYYRAHILFERSEARKWTPEEIELLKEFHEKHGPDWKTLSVELGKHRFHVKDAWRRLKLPNMKKGNWSQDEYQNLFNLVNVDLSMKAVEEKKTKHGMLRDNICWEAISDQLATRINSSCCQKWYAQLTSPMVAEGDWANADDYRLLIALVELDAACEEDVDWDNLLEHRGGDVCRKRWNEMVRHIGEYGTKPFSEQVEILSQRYCPDILESREIFDSKPPVD